MSRYERMVFKAEDFATEVAYRETFGWEYVRQTPRSRTVRAYHSGGAMSTGSGFIGGGTTSYKTLSWYDIEMRRDRQNAAYDTLVRCEQIYESGGAAPLPESPESFWAMTLVTFLRLGFVSLAVFMVGGVLEFFFPQIKNAIEEVTQGVSLSVFVLTFLAGLLAVSLLWAGWHLRRILEDQRLYRQIAPRVRAQRNTEREEALQTALRIVRNQTA
jgi:hypothetical protein